MQEHAGMRDPTPLLTKGEGRRALPEMSHQGVSIVNVHKRAAALAAVACEVSAAHIAEAAQRVLQLIVPLQLGAREVAQLKGKDIVRLSAHKNF